MNAITESSSGRAKGEYWNGGGLARCNENRENTSFFGGLTTGYISEESLDSCCFRINNPTAAALIIFDQQRPSGPRGRMHPMSQRHPEQNDIIMFVTTNTLNRRPVFANPAYAREAIDNLYRLQELHQFLLFGFVIMPNHLHLLLNVPSPYTISKCMNAYKAGLTFDLGIGAFWQPKFDLRIPKDSLSVLRYIHANPVKAKLCDRPEDYPWSSASGQWEISQLA